MKKHLIILLGFCFLLQPSYGQNSSDSSIITEGKSSVSVTPDRVSFRVQLQTLDLNRRKSIEMAFETINDVKSQMRDIGVNPEDLKTNRFNLTKVEVYNRNTNKNEFKGYRTDIELMIKLDYSDKKIDAVFDIYVDRFDDNFNMQFELSDDLIEQSKEKLIELAIEDSRNKAAIISKNTGVNLGPIIKAQYGDPNLISNFGQPNLELVLRGGMDERLVASTSVLETLAPQEIEINTNIIIGWAIIE